MMNSASRLSFVIGLCTVALLSCERAIVEESVIKDEQDTRATSPVQTNAPKDTAIAQAAVDAPNIVLILVDDLGYGQLGYTGHPIIKTPTIDRLASQGIIFSHAYSGSTVCSPSRVSLLTGQDAAVMPVNANTALLRAQDGTAASMLKSSGYDTALFGKFGVGTTFGKNDPMAMGFDHWYGLLHNVEAHRQYPTLIYEDNEVKFVPENVAGAKGAYAQRLYTDAALRFIDTRNKDEPFFMMMSYTSPHAEIAAPDEFVTPYLGQFDDKPWPGRDGERTPEINAQFPDYYPDPIDEPTAVSAGMVAALDSYVGELLSALEAKGIAENTLIIFTSDNGPHSEGGGHPDIMQAGGPFRGGKRDLYEGGIHMPMLAYWPRGINVPREVSTPVAFADFLPTFADLSQSSSAAMRGINPNGLSFAKLLTTKDVEEDLPERQLYWEFGRQVGDPNSGVVGPTAQALRDGRWKAVRVNQSAPLELYDILADPGETNNLAAEYPDRANEILTLFDARLND